MNTLPLVSIIIPVFNLENYLHSCLKSILSQDYKNLEIICINDGSDDNSGAILEYFKKNDKRIKVINKTHTGSGKSRNLGIEYACGKYTFFVDGDDFLENHALINMVEKAEREKTDIVVFGAFSYYSGGYKTKKYAGTYNYKRIPHKFFKRVFSCDDIKKDITKFPATAWTKLYKSDFLKRNKIKFQDTKVGQDQLFFFHSMISAKRITVLEKNIYCYRKNRKGSAMTDKKKKSHSPIDVFYGIENLLISKNLIDKYESVFINKYFIKSTSWLGKIDKTQRALYYSKYIQLLNHIKIVYPDGWWIYFSPNIKDKIFVLRCKIYLAKFIKQMKDYIKYKSIALNSLKSFFALKYHQQH